MYTTKNLTLFASSNTGVGKLRPAKGKSADREKFFICMACGTRKKFSAREHINVARREKILKNIVNFSVFWFYLIDFFMYVPVKQSKIIKRLYFVSKKM